MELNLIQHPTSSYLGIGPNLIQHCPTLASSPTISNIIQPWHWTKPYPTLSNLNLEHNLIWQSMISKYSWYPNIHDIQISMISRYPWYPNIHDVQISIYTWYPNVHTCHMWAHLTRVVTLVICGHTCHPWSPKLTLVTCGPTCHNRQKKFHKMAPHPTFETMIRWLLLLHLFANSTCRPAGRSRW